jgi:hypothetical protein
MEDWINFYDSSDFFGLSVDSVTEDWLSPLSDFALPFERFMPDAERLSVA